MKPTIFLRIASALALIEAVLHTIGGVFGQPLPGAATIAVLAMKSNHFQVFGLNRTYWNFFIGFGLAITVFLAVESMVFWVLGNLAKIVGPQLKPILWLFLIGYLALATLAYRYFFFGPLVSDLLIAGCLAFALATLSRLPKSA
jgi:hypothetical protein